jgi:DNA-binding NtrC family response regulator
MDVSEAGSQTTAKPDGMTASTRSRRQPWPRLEGVSDAVRQLEHAIGRVARFECPVLVTGETGCGKEEVARAIHAAGPRRTQPFVAMNCGGLVASIAESQLFGHEKGSFTGAVGTTLGGFRSAHGGVLFLDEIGEMPLEIQPKLLQVLQRWEVAPVGSSEPVPIDVQVIAATNRDLAVEVERGSFREDLFYRLTTVHLVVPPLRTRRDDIPRFIEHFSAHFAAQYGRPPWQPRPDVLVRLVRHAWPGNVRQLAQMIQRLYVFEDDADLVVEEVLTGSDGPRRAAAVVSPAGAASVAVLPAGMTSAAVFPASMPSAAGAPLDQGTLNLREVRLQTVRRALTATEGHFGKAATLLGVCPNTMTKLAAEAYPELAAARQQLRRIKPR